MRDKPIIRTMKNGDVIVDFGHKWFRCLVNGQVIVRIVENGFVKSRPATSKERLIALGHAAFDRDTSHA